MMMRLLTALLLTLAGCEGRGEKFQSHYVPVPPPPPPAYPAAVSKPIDPSVQKDARAELQSALHSTDELIRAHALEAVKDLRLSDADAEVINALRDRSLLVRKAAAMTAGELQITAAADRLQELLQAEASSDDPISAEQERMAGIFALHRLGNTQYSHEFEQTAADPRSRIRGETAFILGLLGDKSAVPILTKMLKQDTEPHVSMQAAEALWRLGDENGETVLVAGTISAYADDQMLAIFGLAQPRNAMVLGNIEGMFNSDFLEVRLVCARAAGMLGSDHGYGIAMQGAKSTDPRQRTLAAMAFGAIGRSDTQPLLAKLLKDTDADVRLASAEALLLIGQRP